MYTPNKLHDCKILASMIRKNTSFWHWATIVPGKATVIREMKQQTSILLFFLNILPSFDVLGFSLIECTTTYLSIPFQIKIRNFYCFDYSQWKQTTFKYLSNRDFLILITFQCLHVCLTTLKFPIIWCLIVIGILSRVKWFVIRLIFSNYR